jgi:hypothetical protein
VGALLLRDLGVGPTTPQLKPILFRNPTSLGIMVCNSNDDLGKGIWIYEL